MHTLILANPGTGKTRKIAETVIELLENNAVPEDILCITFTNKAAGEMKDRIMELASKRSGMIYEKSLRINVHTFHSFAYSALEDSGISYTIVDDNLLRYAVFKSFQVNNAFHYTAETVVEEIVPKVVNAIRYLKSLGLTIDEIKRNQNIIIKQLSKENVPKESGLSVNELIKFLEYFIAAYDAYEKIKGNSGIDYNDILLKYLSMPLVNKKIYAHVLVDELQDLNELEANIALNSGSELILAGDKKQAIFGFQGGSTKNFKKFQNNYKTLSINYRSAKRIVEYSKAYFLRNVKNGNDYVELDNFKAEKEEEGSVKILRISHNNPVKAAVSKALDILENSQDGSIAIVARTNSQVMEISSILDKLSVNYISTYDNSTSAVAKKTIITFLRGLFYDDVDIMINALFTPYSGILLKDAFDIAQRKKMEKETFTVNLLLGLVPEFCSLRASILSKDHMQLLFENRILPIASSLGRDHFITALSVSNNINKFFEIIPMPDIDDMFSYLNLSDESYESAHNKARLTVTTVHKAKGLEFDHVVYVPKKPKSTYSYVDNVVQSIIKAIKNEDLSDEISEESIRVDFVAITRAKKSLCIVGDNIYHVDGISEIENDSKTEINDLPVPNLTKYNEAYHLFVAGNLDYARNKLDEHYEWLNNVIVEYFHRIDRVSYSMIESLNKDPYIFFKTYILNIPSSNRNLVKGSDAHDLASCYFKGSIKKEMLNSEQKVYLANIDAIMNEIKKRYPGSKQIDSELKFTVPMHKLMSLPEESSVNKIMLTGRIDAIIEIGNGRYLIIDYKTDRDTEYGYKHRMQLAVYKNAYGVLNAVAPENIEVAIAYIYLTGKINTGNSNYMLDSVQPKSGVMNTFKNHVEALDIYIKDPSLYIKDFINNRSHSDELLYKTVAGLLSKHL